MPVGPAGAAEPPEPLLDCSGEAVPLAVDGELVGVTEYGVVVDVGELVGLDVVAVEAWR